MLKSEYKNIFENEASNFYYQGTHFLILSEVNRIANSRKLKILDAGCGTGLLAQKLQKYGDVTAIDASPVAIAFSKKRGVDAVLGSVEKLPFKSNSFDVVVSIDVLYHKGVINDRKAIKEFKRVLKKGGYLILKLPAFGWLSGKHDEVVYTKKRYYAGEVLKLLKKEKLEMNKLTYICLFLLPFAVYKRVIESIFPGEAKSDLKKLPELVNNILLWFYKLEVGFVNLANLPIGLSVFAVAQKP